MRYGELAPMLLNEAQQQQRKIAAQAESIAARAAEIRDLKQQQVRDKQPQSAELKDLKQELQNSTTQAAGHA